MLSYSFSRRRAFISFLFWQTGLKWFQFEPSWAEPSRVESFERKLIQPFSFSLSFSFSLFVQVDLAPRFVAVFWQLFIFICVVWVSREKHLVLVDNNKEREIDSFRLLSFFWLGKKLSNPVWDNNYILSLMAGVFGLQPRAAFKPSRKRGGQAGWRYLWKPNESRCQLSSAQVLKVR